MFGENSGLQQYHREELERQKALILAGYGNGFVRDDRSMAERLKERREYLEKEIKRLSDDLAMVNEAIEEIRQHPVQTRIIDLLRKLRFI